MTLFSDALRVTVNNRAGNRCEYCLLPTRGQVATFPIDHVIPRSRGGLSAFGNLALACPHCNAYKWNFTEGHDPETGQALPLFNPRLERWADHFQWSRQTDGLMEAKTACGRATIARLQLNEPDLIATRRLLAALQLFPELAR